MQTRFRQILISDKKIDQLKKVLKDNILDLRKAITNEILLEEIVLKGKPLTRNDTRLRRKPEDVTEGFIEKILEVLEYSQFGRKSGAHEDRDEADYNLEVKDKHILVEVEAFNKKLQNVKNEGIEQLKSYLEKKSFRSDIGFATNGFEWILMKYDNKIYKFRQIEKIDLRPVINHLMGYMSFSDTNEILCRFYKFFSSEYILISSDEFEKILEEKKENITSNFYKDYIKYVFGYDRKIDLQTKCLLNSINTHKNSTERDKRLFVINLMNRLIFIKFLEDKKIVESKFLSNLFRKYRDKHIPASFYQTYLEPLFYDVLNTRSEQRNQNIISNIEFNNIPYLNGGLFRETVSEERNFDVNNDILGIVIDLLERFSFTIEDKPDTLNPDILGLVFEKTINYLTGDNNNRKKDLGAYYTPDDVTTFISKNVIQNKIYDKIVKFLYESGWKKSDVNQYRSFEDFLNDPPKNPKTLRGILEIVSKITILDPACGSGHFLTSVLKELFFINKFLSGLLEEDQNNFLIKKNIIVNNIYGVDIESSAIEIARLRLWLSLLEDLDLQNDKSGIEILPNIEYNIKEGNSLIGYTESSDFDWKNLENIDEKPTMAIFEEIDNLKNDFHDSSDPNTINRIKKIIDDKLNKYNSRLNKRLLVSFNKECKVELPLEKIIEMEPFHWRLEFSNIFLNNRGFDIIIGNPPYIEKNKLTYPDNFFVTNECGNSYAYFFEISLKIISPSGYIGFIVPVSSVCTPRMDRLQKMLIEKCDILKISNFDDRPGKLFDGLEHCRSSIIIGRTKEKGIQESHVYTTKYNRWYSENRSSVFDNLQFVESTNLISHGIIPKLGKKLEVDLLSKLRKEPPLSKYILKKTIKHKEGLKSYTVWYHNAPQYWIRAMNFIPQFQGNETNISSHVKTFYADGIKRRDLIISILNSSLFYWYFVITSNGRDLTIETINSFGINLDKLSDSNSELLTQYCQQLMTDLQQHSKIKTTNYEKTGRVIYQEFFPMYSKNIIDKIDDVLADHYGFTEDEKQFIKKFDQEFRMGKESGYSNESHVNNVSTRNGTPEKFLKN